MDAANNGEERRVWIVNDAHSIEGTHAYLGIPPNAHGVVIFADDRETIQHSPRNRYLVDRLRKAGIATLSPYLLTPYEESLKPDGDGALNFDLGLITERLLAATTWLQRNPETRDLPIGYFGAGAGGAAALMAAAANPDTVRAVVARSSRPELSGKAATSVGAPTLLIVGERDAELAGSNRQALDQLAGARSLEIVPGAGHLFEEPGAIERVAELASAWFAQHLAIAAHGAPGATPASAQESSGAPGSPAPAA